MHAYKVYIGPVALRLYNYLEYLHIALDFLRLDYDCYIRNDDDEELAENHCMIQVFSDRPDDEESSEDILSTARKQLQEEIRNREDGGSGIKGEDVMEEKARMVISVEVSSVRIAQRYAENDKKKSSKSTDIRSPSDRKMAGRNCSFVLICAVVIVRYLDTMRIAGQVIANP